MDIFISRKLYPQDMDVPDDSDYDNQEDVDPVETDLMPLEKQDPKLQADYITLPEIPYALRLTYTRIFLTMFVYIDIERCNLSSRVITLLRSILLSGELWKQKATNMY
jgi:hypothetical protein